jgi:hypothetical protein
MASNADTPAWSTPLNGAATQPYTFDGPNACSGTVPFGGAVATSLAAAVPSGTLVVTASDGVHILSLTTGTDQWHGAVPGATNPVHDPVIVGNNVYVVDSPLQAADIGISVFGPGKLIALSGM